MGQIEKKKMYLSVHYLFKDELFGWETNSFVLLVWYTKSYVVFYDNSN